MYLKYQTYFLTDVFYKKFRLNTFWTSNNLIAAFLDNIGYLYYTVTKIILVFPYPSSYFK